MYLQAYIKYLFVLAMAFDVSPSDAKAMKIAPSSSARYPVRFLYMGNEVQKIDRAVVKKKNPVGGGSNDSMSSIFKSPPAVGAGNDERYPAFPGDSEISSDATLLSNIELSYRKHNLLSHLSSNEIGLLEKMEKVRAAVRSEIISSHVHEVELKPLSFVAAGLLDDWNFNI